MKKKHLKLNLEELTVKSFVTADQAQQVKAGIATPILTNVQTCLLPCEPQTVADTCADSCDGTCICNTDTPTSQLTTDASQLPCMMICDCP